MDLYAENILQHFKHPVGKAPLSEPSVTHEEINHSCGDRVSLSLLIRDGVIAKLGWDGDGCAISQGGMSILAEELNGKTLEQADAMTTESVKTLLGVPIGPRRFKCALLGLHTLKNALRKYSNEDVQTWTETVGDH